MRRDLDSARGEKALLGDSILGDRDARRVGAHAAALRQELQRGGRYVLEFGRRRAATACEFGQRTLVQVVCAQMIVRDRTGRAVVTGIEHADFVAERLRSHAEHATKLASAEQTQPGTWRDRCNSRRRRSHRAGRADARRQLQWQRHVARHLGLGRAILGQLHRQR